MRVCKIRYLSAAFYDGNQQIVNYVMIELGERLYH